MNVMLAAWVRLSDPRLCWGAPAAALLFAALVTFVTFSLLQTEGSVMGFGGGRLRPTDFAGPDGPARVLERLVMLLGLIAAALNAHQLGGEYSGRTIRSALLVEPRRIRLMVGTLLTTVLFSAGTSLLTAFLAVSTSYVLAPSAGIDTAAWWTIASLAESTVATGSLMVGVLAYGIAGGCLGVILRSSAAAIVVAGAYGLFEGALAAFAGPDMAYFPGQVFAAVARGGTPEWRLDAALVAAAGWCILMLLTAAVVTRRRDVTD
jgi:hypothetical protein